MLENTQGNNKYTIDFRTRIITTWSRNMSKLSVFLYLMLLVNISRAETTTETLTAVINENPSIDNSLVTNNGLEITTTTAVEVETSTDIPAEIATTTAINSATESVSDNNDIGGTQASNVEATNENQTENNDTSNLETNTDSVTSDVTDSTTNADTNTVTEQIECVCDCVGIDNQLKLECSTTPTPADSQTQAAENSESNPSSVTDETTGTTTSTIEDETSTNENNLEETTNESNQDETATNSNNINPTDESNAETTISTIENETSTNMDESNGETTTQSNAAPETTTTTAPPLCDTPGVQPYATDCQKYYECSSEGSLDGSFHLLTKSCPDKQAFNIELNRCSRDISSCPNNIQCVTKIGIADPNNNLSYYLCEPRLVGAGYRIYHIDCSSNEIFYPELGKCFVDINNLPSLTVPLYNWNQIRDYDIVKAERKLLKEQDKLVLKQEKERIKAEAELQKQLAKEALNPPLTTIPQSNAAPKPTTTTTSTAPSSETTTASASCVTAAVKPHETDCQKYYICSAEGSLDGSLHLLTKSCPEKQAFNTELQRCSRDISSCSTPIQCISKGGIADPSSNSSYYLCDPLLIGVGYRIFHIDCSSNEIFYPELGKCFVDINNLPSLSSPPSNWNQISDYDLVKAELKLLKDQDKLILKQEKERKKAEEKLQKQLAKEAKNRAKEEEKANKAKAKQELANFVCAAEGNFASQFGESTYYACIPKKGKLSPYVMQCGYGAKFDSVSGTCINGAASISASVSIEDDDDD